MRHDELLDRFFSRRDEEKWHKQILEDENFEVPVAAVKDFMVQLTEIPLTAFFNYLDNHPLAARWDTSDITQCGALAAFTEEWCAVLHPAAKEGKTIMEIGQSPLYEKYLRSHNKAAWSRYGNHQAKTASQLGLAFKNERRWYLSGFGYAYVYPHLTQKQQQRFLSRALLRNPFYAQLLTRVRTEDVYLQHFMGGLSASTQGSRSGSVVKLLRICLEEMEREGIKWHDIHVPGYSVRKKEPTERVIKGTKTVWDAYTVADDYFDGGIPFYTVKAACGYFVDHEVPEMEGWLDLTSAGVKTNSKDFFVVRAKGDSMLPKIKDGDLCLFKWYRGEALCNDIVLTQCREYDAEYESCYTIKRFHRQFAAPGEVPAVSLEPLNKDHYRPIVLSAADGCVYQTIGIFVKVLSA